MASRAWFVTTACFRSSAGHTYQVVGPTATTPGNEAMYSALCSIYEGVLGKCITMKCPACSIDLQLSERQGVEIDYCPQCRGVWLDRGELDKIIEHLVSIDS
jgi:hypothetical protein